MLSVIDDMAMGTKRQGDTNKMEQNLNQLIDPLDWTIDQVVAVLCHNFSMRLDPSFGVALREQQVNGEMLLKAVEDDLLREHLGLKVAGDRFMVLTAIEQYRKILVKYHC